MKYANVYENPDEPFPFIGNWHNLRSQAIKAAYFELLIEPKTRLVGRVRTTGKKRKR